MASGTLVALLALSSAAFIYMMWLILKNPDLRWRVLRLFRALQNFV